MNNEDKSPTCCVINVGDSTDLTTISRFSDCLISNSVAVVNFTNKWWETLLRELLGLLHFEKEANFNVPIQSTRSSQVYAGSYTLIPFAEAVTKVIDGDAYLKDWHFEKDLFRVQVPTIFLDDWLNWYWRVVRACDDYSFVYVGGRSTFTGVHHDVCCSYSWSLNLQGTKRWTLWRPRHTAALFPKLSVSNAFIEEYNSECVFDTRVGVYDASIYSEIASTDKLVITQGEGEVIFVPSGWHHMVENLGSETEQLTVSFNRNWINGFCIHEVWLFLLREVNAVRLEVWHHRRPTGGMCIRDWNRHCDLLLKANSAINIEIFVSMLCGRALLMDAYAHSTLSEWIKTDDNEWSIRLCGSFKSNMLSADDFSLFGVQTKAFVDMTAIAPNFELLSYYYRFPKRESDVIVSFSSNLLDPLELLNIAAERSGLRLWEADHCVDDRGAARVTVWQYTVLQMVRVLLEILSCEALLLHGACCALEGGINEMVAVYDFKEMVENLIKLLLRLYNYQSCNS